MAPRIGPRVNVEYVGEPNSDRWQKAMAWFDRVVATARTPERLAREWDWLVMQSWFHSQPWYWRERIEGKTRRVWVSEEERTRPILMNLMEPRVDALVGSEAFIPRYVGRNTAQMGTEDHIRVRAAGDVANHAVAVCNLGSRKTEADLIKHMFGLAWFKPDWDPRAGAMVPTKNVVVCPVCNGTCLIRAVDGLEAPCITCEAEGLLAANEGREWQRGQLQVDGDMDPEGDVSSQVIPPWEVYVDPSHKDPLAPEKLVHEFYMDKDAAYETYLDDLEDIKPEDLQVGSGQQIINQLIGGFNATMYAQTNSMVTVRELRIVPCDEFEQGLWLIDVGGVICDGGPLPYQRMNFVPYRCYSRVGRYYPKSTVERLLPVQMAHHQLVWNIQDHVDMATHMRLITDKGVTVQLDDLPGVVKVSRAGAGPQARSPEFLKDPGIPPDAWQQLQNLERHADEVSYCLPLMRGETSGESSARHDAWLEQRQAQPMKRMLEDNAASLKKVGQILVEIIRDRYPNGRQLRDVFGSGGQMLMREYSVERLGSSANVDLVPERDIGRTRSSRNEELLDAFAKGAMQDPEMRKLMGIESPDAAWEEDASDQYLAQWENDQLTRWDLTANPPQMGVDPMTGGPQLLNSPMPPPALFENQQIHRKVHVALWNRLKRTYGTDHPLTMALYDHLVQTDEMEAQQQMRQQALVAGAAAQYGMQNGGGQNAAESAADANPAAPQGEPGAPETQPALKAVDNSLRG